MKEERFLVAWNPGLSLRWRARTTCILSHRSVSAASAHAMHNKFSSAGVVNPLPKSSPASLERAEGGKQTIERSRGDKGIYVMAQDGSLLL